MVGEPIISNSNKNLVISEINKTHLAAVFSATYLKRYLITSRGPIENYYLDFYECFYALFILTSPFSKIIKSDADKELQDKISDWVSAPKTPISIKNAQIGIDLFREWQKLLAKRDVITL